MKKLLGVLSGGILMLGAVLPLSAVEADCGGGRCPKMKNNMANQIPTIEFQNKNWEKVQDVAQFAEADWSQVVGKARHVSIKEAMEIAESHTEITYFFVVKGGRLALGEKGKDNFRFFKHGEVVFFSGKPHWGEAKGLADGYVKKAPAATK